MTAPRRITIRAAVRRWAHWLAHRFGRNAGTVEVYWHGPRLMVGFRCGGCGELCGQAVIDRRSHG